MKIHPLEALLNNLTNEVNRPILICKPQISCNASQKPLILKINRTTV